MLCPACGSDQPEGDTCLRCGVIVAKARAAKREPPGIGQMSLPKEQGEDGRRLRVAGAGLALTAVVAVVGLAGFIALRNPPTPRPLPLASPAAQPPDAALSRRAPEQPTAAPSARSNLQSFAPLEKPQASPPTAPTIPGATPPVISDEAFAALEADITKSRAATRPLSSRAATSNTAGVQAYAKGDLATAERQFREALQVDPRNLAARINLGALYFDRREYRAARAALLEALSIDASSRPAMLLLGRVAYAEEDVEEAQTWWRKARIPSPADDSERLINARIAALLAQAERERQVATGYQQQRSAHFILRYEGTARAAVGDDILRALEGRFTDLANFFDYVPADAIVVLLYPEQQYFDVTRAPSWSGGRYDGKIRIPAGGLSTVDSGVSRVLTHELAHAFIAAKTRENCPSWLHEGLAQIAEGSTARGQERALVDGLAASRNDVTFFYLSALSQAEFLLSRGGTGGLRQLLEGLGRREQLDQVFQRAVSYDVPDFLEAWRRELRDKAR